MVSFCNWAEYVHFGESKSWMQTVEWLEFLADLLAISYTTTLGGMENFIILNPANIVWLQ